MEAALRAALGGRVRRGNISAVLTVNRVAPPAIRINRDMLARVLALVGELSVEVEAAPPRIDGLIALRGIIETVEDEPDDVTEARRDAIAQSWSSALDRLAGAPGHEGARLEAVLSGQLSQVAELVAPASARAAAPPPALRAPVHP